MAKQQSETETKGEAKPRCLFCGAPEHLIWVHGHGQCAHCGVNAMPCCDGVVCEPQRKTIRDK